jgi:hypothetical protein
MLSEWADVLQLKQVRLDLDRCIEAVQNLDCPAWLRYVEGYRSITDEHLDRCTRQHLGKVFGEMEAGSPKL